MDYRVPRSSPEFLDERQQSVYQELAGGQRASGPFRLIDRDGSLTGPFGPMVLAPRVGAALGRLGTAIRYESGLDPRMREIVILAVAAHFQSEFEWYAHERVAEQVGLAADEIARLWAGRCHDWPEHTDGLIHRLALALAAERVLGEELFSEARTTLGLERLIEIIVTVGYYSNLDLILSALQIGVPVGEEFRFPPHFDT